MGLDMYLERMPRYKKATANDVYVIENYLGWKTVRESVEKYANCTLKEWCGIDEKDLPSKDYIDYYKQFYKPRYWVWDTEKEYPNDRITEEVGYWRKQNAIHNWFVNNIQDGIDDCKYHREVTKEDLEELLDICETVLTNSELIEGQVVVGYEYKNGVDVPVFEDGKYIEDITIADELLPTTSGFFFGSVDYDEWYIEGIKNTVDIITRVLETTDFDKEMIYYVSSW